MLINYWSSISGEKKIQPFLHFTYCYQCSNWPKLTPDHEKPLAIVLLKGISCVSTHYNTGLLLFNDMFTNYWSSISGEKKIQPFLHFTYCYQCSNWPKLTPDHEIPLAIVLLKGISCVSTHYNTGLLLFNDMLINYWSSITGEKKISLSNTSLIVTSVVTDEI
jgi:hypothetical protein